MKTDRELLEWAAKAIGAEYRDHALGGQYLAFAPDWNGRRWSPLADDGDALRLAVKLGLTVHAFPDHHQGAQSVVTMTRHAIEAREYAENNADDLNAATRRAIVRAAAAIGEQS